MSTKKTQSPPFTQHTCAASWMLLSCMLLCLGWHSQASAQTRDVRLALLIGNQDGWSGDPWLNYVIKGDLRPMEKALKHIGFEVIVLENQTADAIRAAFNNVKERINSSLRPTTFLFYYTGHADKTHFHTGPKTGQTPISYRGFRDFFYKLPIKRRVAIIDACHSGQIVREFGSEKKFRKLLKRGLPKGVRAQRSADLIRLLKPSQGRERGLRVIGSSRYLSWEIRKYKASVFTYHLLRGLKGKADTNQDGRISLDELFAFTRQQVYNDTGQRPQQYKQVVIGEPYSFAPAYRSRLRIGPNVLGQLKISVANFVWVQDKQTKQPLRLAIVDGKGVAYLRRQKRCFQQPVNLPKGGEAILGTQGWKLIPCTRLRRTAKGVTIQGVTEPMLRNTTERWLNLALHAGYAYLGEPTLDEQHHMAFGLNLRHQWFGIGAHLTTGSPARKNFQLTRLLLRAELGYPKNFDGWETFFGLYFHGGVTFQAPFDQPLLYMAFSMGAGGGLDMSWWVKPWLGVRVGAKVGFDYTPTAGSSGISLQAQAQLALLFGFLRQT